MVHLQLTAELLAHTDKLPDTHALTPLPRLTCSIQHVPGLAEMVVEVVHVLGHAVVDAEVMLGELGEGRL